MAAGQPMCDCLRMADTQGGRPRWDFFVSYTGADQAWAEWVAWKLEEESYEVLLQAWDFLPGSNWVQFMHSGIRDSDRTIAILSSAYLESAFGQTEWQAAWAKDPEGTASKLLTVRVSDCERPGLLNGVVGIDLFGIDEETAHGRLQEMVAGVMAGRTKPTVAPGFPGTERTLPAERPFPGEVPPSGKPSPTGEREDNVARLSDFRRRRNRAAADAPDASHLSDLIAELLESTGRVAASYSAGDGEYMWLRFRLNPQLASVDSELKEINEWLARIGMGDDLSTFNLRHPLRLYSGTASKFIMTLDNLESRHSSAEQRMLLDDYQSAERTLANLLWQIYHEFDAASRYDSPFGQR
jgi:TIR domain-containing protein